MIHFTHLHPSHKRKAADALVIPFWKGKQRAEPAVSLEASLSDPLMGPLEAGDFRGKESDILCLYPGKEPEKRFILIGLGEENRVTQETLRVCYGALVKSCLAKKWRELNIILPDLPEPQLVMWQAIIEGMLSANYLLKSSKQKGVDEPEERLLEKVVWIAPRKEILEIASKMSAVAEGVYYARDLVNGNADEITPQYLAECAKRLAKEHSTIKTTLFDKKRLEKEQMGLLLAVSRGSSRDPALIFMEYKGNPHSSDHTVLVGKGVTYDTGGLNLKPTGSMETMKCDMAGAAACFGTLVAVCLLHLKVNLTIVVPATENGIDANSFKPGDVYPSYSGKTVEMTNSDAEGRLILADALAYAVEHLRPTRVVDLATLTGAIDIALGPEAAGLMSTDEELAGRLMASGAAVFERLWRMPLFDEYKERLKSDIADLKSWNGRAAGANVAAIFLRQFVGSIPWAHIDIASTAYAGEAKKYTPKYATGFGVRLMTHFLEQLPTEKKRKAKVGENRGKISVE